MRKIITGVAVGTLTLLGTITLSTLVPRPSVYAQSPNPTLASPQAASQNILVHLKHGTDDLHAVFMALKIASNLQKNGTQVTLLLTLEGVRIVDTTQPLDLRWGKSNMTVADLYQEFLAVGGKVIVCPVCAEAAGITARNLRSGAQLALENDDIPNLILSADKILDF